MNTLITCLLSAAAVLLGIAAQPAAGAEPATVLRIRPTATIPADAEVTLGDVLLLDEAPGELRALLADAALPAGDGPADARTHAAIAARLVELGVNRARVDLVGAAECRLTIEPAARVASAQTETIPAAAVPATSAPGFGDATLAEAIRAALRQELAHLGGEIELEFERAGSEVLELTSPPWDFSVATVGGATLGLREFRITISRDGQTNRTVKVTGRVSLSKPVAVARKPLGIGVLLRPEDFELQPRTFNALVEMGIADPATLVGRQLKRFIAAGELVRGADVKTVDIVQRSRPVTVLGGGSGVRMRLSGVALDSGALGDRVRVRLGDARKAQREVRGIVTGVGTVEVRE